MTLPHTPRATWRISAAVATALAAPFAAGQAPELFRVYPTRTQPLTGTPFAVVAADFDGDGDRDVAASSDSAGLRLFRNDGLGNLPIDLLATVLTGRMLDLHAVDVDGDGDLDIVGAEASIVLRNDGRGRFTNDTAAIPSGALARTTELAVVDLDGDGDLDLVHTGQDAPKGALFNDGAGRFLDLGPRFAADPFVSRTVAVGDVDGDGDVDVVFAGYRPTPPYTESSSLHLNDGTGHFTMANGHGLRTFEVGASSSALTDVDGDGDLDYLIAQWSGFGTSQPGVRMLLNDGSGHYTEAPAGMLPADQPSFAGELRAADADRDGDIDLLVFFNRDPALWLNDGRGAYTIASNGVVPAMPDPDAVLYDAVWGDLDDDGDHDLVFTTSTNGSGIVPWFNQSVQIDATTEPRLGQSFGMQISRRPLGSANLAVAVPLVADTRTRIELPSLGVLGLMPGRALALPPVLLAPNGGATGFSIAVPDDPDLEGVEMFWQAAILESGPGAADRLTNVWPSRILR